MRGFQNVIYWGQHGSEKDLADYCISISGIDIIVLAFLSNLLQDTNTLTGSFGQSCFVTATGSSQGCDNIASAIKTCQAADIKIILSLGGWGSSISLQSQSQAESVGQYLWDAYGNESNGTALRPFGETFINGFDFDIEHQDGNQYYQYVIANLRSNFAKDPSNKYYITGAPQCSLPEPNMGVIIQNSKFDYLWVQFYNNNCALGIDSGVYFNYNNWTDFLLKTPSSNASLFIGVPASVWASNGTSEGSQYYIGPEQIVTSINEKKGEQNFGGVMIWNAGFSDANIHNGCTYAQNIHHILLTGSTCGQPDPLISSLTTSQTTTTISTWPVQTSLLKTTTSTLTEVPIWGQVCNRRYV